MGAFRLFSVGLLLGIAAPSHAQSQTSDFFTEEFVLQSLADLELEGEEFKLSTGELGWRVAYSDSFVFELHQNACDDGKQCRGLGMYAYWSDAEMSDADVHRYHQNFRFGRAFMFRGRFTVHHYLISDGGITQDNLSENIILFGELAPRIPMHIENLRESAEAQEESDE